MSWLLFILPWCIVAPLLLDATELPEPSTVPRAVGNAWLPSCGTKCFWHGSVQPPSFLSSNNDLDLPSIPRKYSFTLFDQNFQVSLFYVEGKIIQLMDSSLVHPHCIQLGSQNCGHWRKITCILITASSVGYLTSLVIYVGKAKEI